MCVPPARLEHDNPEEPDCRGTRARSYTRPVPKPRQQSPPVVTPPARPERPSRTALAALGAIVLLFLAYTIQTMSTPDIWWQMRAGQLILQNRAWPGTDLLSYTVPTHEWIELRWVFGVLAYLGYTLGGPALLVIAQCVILAAGFTVLLVPLRRALLTPTGLLAAALALAAAEARFNIRPEIFTTLFLCITLTTLDRATRPGGETMRRFLWALPLLQIIWTNTHTVFILGPVVAWAFALGDFTHRFLRVGGLGFTHTRTELRPNSRLDWRLFAVAVGMTLATLVNPWFTKGALFPLTLYTDTLGNSLGSTIQELAPPTSLWPKWTSDLFAAAALVALSALSFMLNWRRTNLIRLGLWLAFFFLAAKSVRNTGPFSAIALWATLRNLTDVALTRPAPSRSPLIPAASLFIAAGALFGAWYTASDRLANSQNSPRRFGLGVTPWVVPQRAVEFMLAHKIKGNVFHSMGDGAYLAFAAAGTYPVYIDGRLEVYTEPFIAKALNLPGLLARWDAFTAEHSINAALIQTDQLQPAISFLMRRADWALVHIDERGVLFLRAIPEHASIIEQSRIDPRVPYVPREPEPSDAAGHFPRALGGVGTPWFTFGMAKNFLALGSVNNAAVYLDRAVADHPDHRRARLLLSIVRKAEGNDAESTRLLTGVTLTPEESRFADLFLAECYRMLGKAAERDALLKKMGESRPAPKR